MNRIAIIGTAGRDKSIPMTAQLWAWMVADAMNRVPKGSHIVSGGAAWADHLAVALYINGHAEDLTLHLPAPFRNGRFDGPTSSSASAANYYHGLFSRVIGEDTLHQLVLVTEGGATGTHEPAAPGYGGMFARNARVAQCEQMLAYTFGSGDRPADGGTAHTWDRCQGQRTHIPLPILTQPAQHVGWDRKGPGYECSSKGDRRFSAFCAALPDGRTIEQHYQCDVKGYQPGGRDWRLGKGKPPLDPNKDLWMEYLALWQTWAQHNPELIAELSQIVATKHYNLTDMFATTPVNQARALAEILNNL